MTDPRIEAAAKSIWNDTDITFDEAYDIASSALAAADNATTITTDEELEALPSESVILDSEGFPYRRSASLGDGDSGEWEGFEFGEILGRESIDYPARVVRWG